jgi:hypothetical protein
MVLEVRRQLLVHSGQLPIRLDIDFSCGDAPTST